MSLIPDDLLTQILLRLPVKSLTRFKCVSKSWLSLISDPNFARTHYELGAACTHRIMVIAPESLDAFSIDSDASLHDDSAIVAMKMNFLHRELEPCFDPVQIMGSCRGFLLLKRKLPVENLCLWNPSSGVHKALPPFSSSDFYGFGYDPSTDDYLVVCGKQRLFTDNQIGFFSLRDNSWKIVSTPFPYQKPPNLMPKAGTLLNEAIHWLAFNYNAKVNVIVSFDLKERTFTEIALPSCLDCCSLHMRFYDMWACGGCLSLCRRKDFLNDLMEIWVMKEYKVASSWIKYYSLPSKPMLYKVRPVLCIPFSKFSPNFFTKKNHNILGTCGVATLVRYDALRQLVLERRSYPNRFGMDDDDDLVRCLQERGFKDYCIQATLYTETLFTFLNDNRASTS